MLWKYVTFSFIVTQNSWVFVDFFLLHGLIFFWFRGLPSVFPPWGPATPGSITTHTCSWSASPVELLNRVISGRHWIAAWETVSLPGEHRCLEVRGLPFVFFYGCFCGFLQDRVASARDLETEWAETQTIVTGRRSCTAVGDIHSPNSVCILLWFHCK